jgi:hypothetical protein
MNPLISVSLWPILSYELRLKLKLREKKHREYGFGKSCNFAAVLINRCNERMMLLRG